MLPINNKIPVNLENLIPSQPIKNPIDLLNKNIQKDLSFNLPTESDYKVKDHYVRKPADSGK